MPVANRASKGRTLRDAVARHGKPFRPRGLQELSIFPADAANRYQHPPSPTEFDNHQIDPATSRRLHPPSCSRSTVPTQCVGNHSMARFVIGGQGLFIHQSTVTCAKLRFRDNI